jgi:hypothetical protein
MALKTGFLDRTKGKDIYAAESVTTCGNTGSVAGWSRLPSALTRAAGLIVGAQFLSAAGTGNTNDTTEDTLYSYSLPANAFDAIIGDMANYRCLWLYAWGLFANNAHSKTARLYFGSSIVVSSGAYATAALTPWALSAVIYHQALNVQVGSGQPVVGTAHGGCIDLNGTETENVAIVIKVTGQTGTAAANDVLLKGCQIGFSN